jgi:Raf kinase inhibitor-like YbhB/YbcL family protein
MNRFGRVLILVGLVLAGGATTASGQGFSIQTTALNDAGALKKEYGASLGGSASLRSFPITWSGLPAGTKAMALTLIDRDYINYVHWLATDIDAAPGGLKDNESLEATFPQGANDTSGYGYFGPMPTERHLYVLTVYALSETTDLEPRFLMEDLTEAMKGKILASTSMELPYDPLP